MAKRGEAARITYRIGADGEIHVRRVGGLSGKKERHQMAKKPRVRWRTGVDGMPYRPLGDRTRKGQKRATTLQRAACVEGAMSALSKGYEGARSPTSTCGPAFKGPRQTGPRASRAGRLLALWRHGSMGEYATVARGKKRKKNPGAPGTVDFVWQPNEGAGSNPCEWAVVEPHSETVLKSGTAKNPKAAHSAAEKISREFVSNPGKFVRAIEEAEWAHHRPGLPYADRDVEVESDGEYVLVPKGRRKKATKRSVQKKAAAGIRAGRKRAGR